MFPALRFNCGGASGRRVRLLVFSDSNEIIQVLPSRVALPLRSAENESKFCKMIVPYQELVLLTKCPIKINT